MSKFLQNQIHQLPLLLPPFSLFMISDLLLITLFDKFSFHINLTRGKDFKGKVYKSMLIDTSPNGQLY